MGETAVKSHAEGKKHASSLKVSQRRVCQSLFQEERSFYREVQFWESEETSSGLAFSRKTEQESNQCEIFRDYSTNFTSICNNKIWLLSKEYLRDHRCEGTNRAYKCKIFEHVT